MQYTEKESFTFTMKVQGEGKVYRVDCWNGVVEETGCFKAETGYTFLTLSLAPGEACLYVIDRNEEAQFHAVEADGCKVKKTDAGFKALVMRSGEYEVAFSDGSKKNFSVEVPEDIPLSAWELEVESWDEGDKKEIIEDRGLGIVTKEVYYETRKDTIPVSRTQLKPWKDIEKVGPEVSGVGCYTTRVTLPDNWSEEDGAILKIEDINKHTAAVYVNGQKAKAVDFDALAVDISDLLKAGENEIKVEVSSSLNNRLLSRGYYEQGKTSSMALADNANNANVSGEGSDEEAGADMAPLFDILAEVKDYGMVGEVKLVTYKKVELMK